MRILQVCNKPPYPPHDGGSLAMFNLANALKKSGHEVDVLTMVTVKHTISPTQLEEAGEFFKMHTVPVDTKEHRFGLLINLLFSKLPYTATRFISDQFVKELTNILEKVPYDIIQMEGIYLTPYIPFIRKHSKAIIALRAHNIEHEIWERMAQYEPNIAKRLYFRLLSKRIRTFELKALGTYDLLVPITNRDLDRLNEMGNNKPAFVCQAGIEGHEPSAMNNKPFSMYFLGSLDWLPNQEGLLWFVMHVLPMLRQNHPDMVLHVAGRNAPDSFIKKLAKPGIIFYGETGDAARFAGDHTLLIAPCFAGSGMRLKIIEAMALGKVVITTTIGAEGIPALNNVNILIADTVKEFNSCIERLLNNDELCKQIGREAFEFATANFNNLNIAASLAAFYKNSLK
jgi:glycosyltransferase involved in cell wall biosynthesis